MRACYLRPLHAAAVLLTLLLGGWGIAAQAQTASNAQHPDPWPRELHIDGATMTVYEPQVDSWDGGFLKFRAAVALKPDGSKDEIFGVIRASAHTLIDKSTRMVSLFNFSVLHVNFPTLPVHGKSYTAAVAKALPAHGAADLPRPAAGLPVGGEGDGQDGRGEERAASDPHQLQARGAGAGPWRSRAARHTGRPLSAGGQYRRPHPL